MQILSLSVPRARIEPARLAALVFETNASTNSAIWACSDEKNERSKTLRSLIFMLIPIPTTVIVYTLRPIQKVFQTFFLDNGNAHLIDTLQKRKYLILAWYILLSYCE